MKEARAVGKDYVKAIEISVKVAGHGIAFAAEVFSLCECLSQDPDIDLRSYIDEMKTVVQRARGDADATHKQFCAIRSKLLQVCIHMGYKLH